MRSALFISILTDFIINFNKSEEFIINTLKEKYNNDNITLDEKIELFINENYDKKYYTVFLANIRIREYTNYYLFLTDVQPNLIIRKAFNKYDDMEIFDIIFENKTISPIKLRTELGSLLTKLKLQHSHLNYCGNNSFYWRINSF